MYIRRLKLDMTHITSCRNVVSIDHTTSAVVFWLVLPFMVRKNFIRFS